MRLSSALLTIVTGQPPELLYFDHLYSEYRALKSAITIEGDTALFDELYSKREDVTLSWNDVYLFELNLAKFLPVDRLRSRIVTLRYDYRSIAGQKEFDDYMASKPRELLTPPDPTHPPDQNVDFENLLREDLKDLLGRIYLQYAILPVREARLKHNTWIAAGLCAIFLVGLLVFVAVFYARESSGRIASLSIFVVVVAGAMGGFVSALQRIQSSSRDGDSIYNLSLLFNGSYAVFVAPITGAIFALLLFMMFTGKILEGRFFPVMYTPPPSTTLNSFQSPSISPSPITSVSPQVSPGVGFERSKRPAISTPSVITSPQITTSPSPGISGGIAATSPRPSPTPIAVATPKPVAQESTRIQDFLSQSGPSGGDNYALLVIWCFIAGFAERFVPDALDRLISGKETTSGKTS
jgi:hypothetical protein